MTHPMKEGLVGLEVAADYLECSHQYLGKILNNDEEEHELKKYFRHYAGRWRTTYALLDEYFRLGGTTYVVHNKNLASEKDTTSAHEESIE